MSSKIIFYHKGETIIKEGQLDRRMYIILEGSVKITLSDNDEKINVANLNKGDFFGEMSLFNDTPRSATATALEDVKLAILSDKNQLTNFLEINPKFASKMVHILATRLAKTNEILLGEFREANRFKYLSEVSGYNYKKE